MSISVDQATCSVILAASLRDLFPAAKIEAFQATEKCFFCDLTFPYTFEPQMLSLLEERMRDWVKKNLPLKTLEMLPANALQFLQHQECPCPDIIHEKNLVKLVQLDRFAGKAPGKTLKTTGEVKLFKLASVEIQGKSLRLIGTAAMSKEELKERVAALKELPNAHKLAEELGLMSGDVWLPRGETVKKILVEKFFEGFSPITTPALSAKDLIFYHSEVGPGTYELLKTNLTGEGRELFDPQVGTIDRLFLPFSQESIISFLQIITKFLKIFAFDYEGVIVGKPAKLLQDVLKEIKLVSKRGQQPGIEFWIQDSLGRAWLGPQISWNDKVAILSLFHSMERTLALILEKIQGRLPFWLQPEHVRLITLQPGVESGVGEEVKQALKGFRVGIDTKEGPLASRVRRALRERVPFSIVLGSREKQRSELKVREAGSSAEVTVNIETLLSRLRQLESQ